MREMVERARELRRRSTEAERALWALIRSQQLGGYKFRRQASVGPFIVDFLCHRPQLIIEVDGGQHAAVTPYEARRSAWLTARGYRLVRLWNTELLEDPQAAAEYVLEEMEALERGG